MSDIVGKNESVQVVPCNGCSNYLRDKTLQLMYPSCEAFVRIPNDVLEGKVIHDKVLPGQKGDFVYEWDGEGLRHPKYK